MASIDRRGFLGGLLAGVAAACFGARLVEPSKILSGEWVVISVDGVEVGKARVIHLAWCQR